MVKVKRLTLLSWYIEINNNRFLPVYLKEYHAELNILDQSWLFEVKDSRSLAWGRTFEICFDQ